LNKASKVAKSEPVKLTDKIESLLEEIKVLRSENESLKSKLANNSLGDVMNNVKEVNGYQVLTAKVEGVDMNGLRNLGDSLKEKLECGVIVLASSQGKDKVNLIAMVTDEAVKKGAHAGNIIKAIAPSVGGGGGGRPNMAQAGGKNSAGIDEALAKVMDNI
jgi:alanyl-tRNA synthetase